MTTAVKTTSSSSDFILESKILSDLFDSLITLVKSDKPKAEKESVKSNVINLIPYYLQKKYYLQTTKQIALVIKGFPLEPECSIASE